MAGEGRGDMRRAGRGSGWRGRGRGEEEVHRDRERAVVLSSQSLRPFCSIPRAGQQRGLQELIVTDRKKKKNRLFV